MTAIGSSRATSAISGILFASTEELHELLPRGVRMQPVHRMCKGTRLALLATSLQEEPAGTLGPELRPQGPCACQRAAASRTLTPRVVVPDAD